MFPVDMPDTTAQEIGAEFVQERPSIVRTADKMGLRKNPIEIGANGSVHYNNSLTKPNIVGNVILKTGKYGKITTMLDAGFLGDSKDRNDPKKLLSETHGYLLPEMPLHPAAEFDWFSHDRETYWLGLATKNFRLGDRMDLSLDYYPWSKKNGKVDKDSKELWVRSGINFGKGLKGYFMSKKFFKKDKDIVSGKAGLKYDIGKNYCINAEYRNYPMNGGRKKGFYFGVGKGF